MRRQTGGTSTLISRRLNHKLTGHAILKTHPGTGVYSKGSERICKILSAARKVLMRDGYQRLTMRAVALETGITVGNLNYYYRNKSDLLNDLLENTIATYLHNFQIIRTKSGQSPEQQLKALLTYIVQDIGSKETTLFFPELWALSNHDVFASESMHELYHKARLELEPLISKINPTLTAQQVEQLALILSASLEGLTIFVGYDKPFSDQRETIANLTIRGLLDLVKNANHEYFT